jgi:hypothetical protein
MLATQVPTRDAYALWHRIHDYGGWTIDPDSGDVPSTGYAVSLPGFENIWPTDALRPADIVRHLRGVRAARELLGSDRIYAGAWKDGALIYLDASIIVPTYAGAYDLANRWNQIAFYDLASGESVDVVGALRPEVAA